MMKPIQISIHAVTDTSPEEICAALLNTERWSEFEGYSILPGIQQAEFETRTSNEIGSKIKVQNRDGSSHVEEIIEWDPKQKIVLRFQDFSPPLRYFAKNFYEVWEFTRTDTATEVTRSMSMHPKNLLGWLLLLPISTLMKKSFEKNIISSSHSKQ